MRDETTTRIPPIGSMWRERKPYHKNVVMVVEHDAPMDHKNRARVWIDSPNGPQRKRKALASRFDGRAYTPYGLAERAWLEAEENDDA